MGGKRVRQSEVDGERNLIVMIEMNALFEHVDTLVLVLCNEFRRVVCIISIR